MSETPIETMRRAAKLMLERAEAAAPSPWEADDSEVVARRMDPTGQFDDDLDTVVDGLDPANARHIAGMHPDVAVTVAQWLQLEAADYAVHGEDASGHYAYALAVARTYLGEATA